MKKRFHCYLMLFLSCLAHSQPAKEFTLDYKGYNLQIISMAKDGNGNIVLAAKALFKSAADSVKVSATEIDTQGIVLITDETFQVKKGWISNNFFPEKVTYDAAKEQFWIGGSQQEAHPKRPKLFGKWQMVLLRIDAKKMTQKWHPVETEYSCRIGDLVFRDKKLFCTATMDTLDGRLRRETAMVFEISPTQFHKAKYQPYFESPDVLQVARAEQSAAHVMQTATGWSNNNLTFGATLLPYGRFPTDSIVLYKYGKSQLTAQTFTPAAKHSTFYFLTDFSVLKGGNLLLGYVPAAESKFYLLEKTDANLRPIWQQQVDDLQYPDFTNHVIEMPNGKIIAAAANKDKNWSYFVYGADGKLLREIDTAQPVRNPIACLQPWSDDAFVCSFYSFEKKALPNKVLVFTTE